MDQLDCLVGMIETCVRAGKTIDQTYKELCQLPFLQAEQLRFETYIFDYQTCSPDYFCCIRTGWLNMPRREYETIPALVEVLCDENTISRAAQIN